MVTITVDLETLYMNYGRAYDLGLYSQKIAVVGRKNVLVSYQKW